MSYTLFKNYARSFNKELAGDIVHDIFLNYYSKHGRSIFNIPNVKSNRWVYKVVKNHFLNMQYHKNKWVNIVDDPESEDTFFTRIADTSPGSEEGIIGGELDKYCRHHVRRLAYRKGKRSTALKRKKMAYTYERTFELLSRGYEISEIANKLKIDYRKINYYKNQIKKTLGMRINNPFAGNKAEPIKTVSLKQYNEKYKEDYILDFDRQWSDANETAMLVVHKEKEEYLLIKLGKD